MEKEAQPRFSLALKLTEHKSNNKSGSVDYWCKKCEEERKTEEVVRGLRTIRQGRPPAY